MHETVDCFLSLAFSPEAASGDQESQPHSETGKGAGFRNGGNNHFSGLAGSIHIQRPSCQTVIGLNGIIINPVVDITKITGGRYE